MLRPDWKLNNWHLHVFCYNAFSHNIERSGTDLGDGRRWWRIEWQTERVGPRDPLPISAKSLCVPLRSHVNPIQPVFGSS